MVRRTHVRYRLTARRAIARDTITILAGALLAVIFGNLAGFGAPVSDLSSPTPQDSSTIIGGSSRAPHATFPPIRTLGPIVNPSAGFQATPTPIPIITLGPSPSPSPSPKPSVKPSAKPSAKPTASPTAPPPKPSAAFTCSLVTLTLTCTAADPTNATSWTWDWGDPNPTPGISPSDQHTFAQAGCYTVALVATGPGGTATSSQVLPVFDPPGPTC